MKIILLLFICAIAGCFAIDVLQCKNSKPIEGLKDRVKVGTCNKPPCRLRKNTFVDVEFKVKPDRDISNVKNSIQANIAGVPLPFPGVDGTDACSNMYSSDGVTKVGCPLKQGQEYLYKSKIEVLQIYPRVKIVVHWALSAPDGDIMCFEVPARITN